VTFTQLWFDATGRENFVKYVTPLSGEFLEIGCYEGRATCWMLNNTKANVTVIDTFRGSPEMVELGVNMTGIKQRFIENIKPWKNRVTIFEGNSQDILRIINKRFDFVYVDGSHYAGDALRDIVYAWDLLKPNGIMIMDDYTWGNFEEGAAVTRMAIDAFLRCYKGQYHGLTKNAQCVVKRTAIR
jgi:predicted O-methyltransferase YrrM